LTLQPVRVGTGSDEEGMLVFDGDQRLVAVLTHLSDQYGDVSGHWYRARLLASTVTVLPIVYLFLLLARFWEVRPPVLGYAAVLPALILAGLMLGAFGLALSSLIRQLENFAGAMNFVIFPSFFASTAL
jgi:hypothetical protein